MHVGMLPEADDLAKSCVVPLVRVDRSELVRARMRVPEPKGNFFNGAVDARSEAADEKEVIAQVAARREQKPDEARHKHQRKWRQDAQSVRGRG